MSQEERCRRQMFFRERLGLGLCRVLFEKGAEIIHLLILRLHTLHLHILRLRILHLHIFRLGV